MATLARGIPTAIILPLICCFSFIHSQESTNRQEKVLHRAITEFQCESEGFYPDPNDCSVFYRCLDWGESSENSVQSRFTSFKFRCTIGSVFDLETHSCVHASEATRLECRHDFSQPLLINLPKADALQADGNWNNQVDYGVLRPEESNRPPQRPAYTKPSTDAQLEPMNEVDNIVAEPPPRLTRSPPCNADGFFPIENDCTHFYRCVSSGQGFIKYEFSCGEGTVWDSDNNACNHAWAVQRQDCQNVGQDPGAGSAGPDASNLTDNVEGDPDQGNGEVYPDQLGNLSQGSGQPSLGYPNQGNQVDGYPNQGYPNGGNEYLSQSNPNGGSGGYPIKGNPSKDNGYSPQGNPNGGSGYQNQPGNNQNPEPEHNLSSRPALEGEPSESTPSNNANGSSQPIGEPGSQNGSSGTKNSTCLEEGFHPEPTDCKKFYRCVNFNGIYTKFDFECAEGTVWDTSLLTCNFPYAVEQSGCQSNQDNESPISGESNNSNNSGTSSNQQTTIIDEISSSGSNQQGSSTTSSNQSSTSNQQSSSTSSPQTSISSQQTSFTSSQTSSFTSPSSSQTTSSSGQQASTTSGPSSSSSNQQTGTTSSGQSTSNSNQQSDTTSSGNQISSENQNSNKNDQCTEEGFFPSSTNCNKFYRCVKHEGYGYTKYEFNCGPGTVFDPAYNVCNHPSGVTNEKCKNGGKGNITTDVSTTPSAGSETSSTPSPSSSSTKPINNATTTTKLSSGATTTTRPGSNVPTTTKQGSKDSTTAKPTGKPNKNTSTTAKPATSKPPLKKPGSTPSTSNSNSTTSFPPSSGPTTRRPSNISSKPPNSTTKPAGSTKPSNESTKPVGSTKPNNQTSPSSTTPTSSETAANATETTCQNSTKPDSKITCTNAGFYPHPDNCKKFYRCVDWDGDKGEHFSVYHFDCPEGTIFDPSLNSCNHEASVYPPRDCSGSGNATTEPTIPNSSNGTSPEETSMPGDNTNTPMGETTTTSNTTEVSTEQPTGETSTHTGETPITEGADVTTVTGDETTVESTNPQTSVPTESSTGNISPIGSTTVSNISNSVESTTDSNQFTTTTVSYITTNNPSTNNPTTDNPTITNSPTTTETSTSTNEKCPELGPDQFNLVCPTGFRRHPKYCNLFYQCTTSPSNEIKVLTLSCPNGTHYDERKIQCLPPDQAQKCEGSSMDTRILRQMADSVIPIPVKADKSICPNEGSFAYKDDCRLFFKCNKDNDRKLNGFLYQCPEGFAYWSISKRCEKIVKVPCDSGKKATGKPTLAPIEPKNVGTK